jgi:hypothetical protein
MRQEAKQIACHIGRSYSDENASAGDTSGVWLLVAAQTAHAAKQRRR